MSALGDLEGAVRSELAKPDTRAAIEGLEKVVLEAVKNVLEAALPGWLRPFIGGLVDSIAEKGITSLEQLTDKALAGLEPVQVKVGTSALALTVTAKAWPADLPQSPFESLPDGGGTDRNQE